MGHATASKTAVEPIEKLLSQADVAELFGASVRTIERMRASGKLPRPDLKVGKMPRWKSQTIRRWVDEQALRN